jgi:hypothetical protein
MREAAKNFEFERAAALRERIRSLKQRDLGAIFSATVSTVDPAALVSGSNATAPDSPASAVPTSPVSSLSDGADVKTPPASAVASAPIESKSPKPAAKRRAR